MIEIRELTKKFGSFCALNSISFSIEKGSIFGLVGSNGAGKSTLLRTLSGIYQPDAGKILIDGSEPFENSFVKGKIAFISDYPYFLPQSNLDEMALFFAKIFPNWDKNCYSSLCDIFQLDRKEKILNMSKGMQRQAALILSLSTRPHYLLLDEIFDGLDPVMRQLLKKLVFKEVSEHGMTVVVASHNLRELEDFCDHVGLLHRGGVVLERDLDELKLGIHKIQAVLKPMPSITDLSDIDIVKYHVRGSLIELVARGNQKEILKKLDQFSPVFREALPLTLEEVFISEMEAAGYDIDNILKK